MKLSTAEYFGRETLISLKRNNWMTLASIGTVAVALFVFGMFLVIVLNMNNMATTLESRVEISAYLKDDVDYDVTDVAGVLGHIPGVESVRFVSRDEALVEFKERLGDQQYILEALGDDNPLPNAFKVKLEKPELVKNAAEAIAALDVISEARYGQEVVEHLFEMTQFVRVLGLSIMLVLAGATLFIISNTIRLTVFARRREVAIMKYVGATDWFIRWPFLLEGILLGAFGGVIAAVLLNIAYSIFGGQVTDFMAFFPLIPAKPFMTIIGAVVVVSGMIIGAAGSVISLRRFLEA